MIERDKEGKPTGRKFDECVGECGDMRLSGHHRHTYLCKKCLKVLKDSRNE